MRYYASDILDAIKTILDTDLSAMITTIRTERSDSTIPLPKNITWGFAKHQYPEIFIDIIDSSIDLEDGELTLDIGREIEIYTIEVGIQMKYLKNEKIIKYMEYYIEAVKRVLHGSQSNSNITWIYNIETVRDDVQTAENNFMKMAGVRFSLRIN